MSVGFASPAHYKLKSVDRARLEKKKNERILFFKSIELGSVI